VAQAAAVQGLADVTMLERTPGAVARARGTLITSLCRVPGVQRVLPGAANFLCLRLAAPAQQVCPMLLHEHGILVRDLTHMPGMNAYWVRVAVRGPRDNEPLVAALAAVLLTLGPARGDRAADRLHLSTAKTMGG
jgi:histidinol-phosphate/aromatic aminotransferase/cobyric acid decarboxylase-like protein